MLTAKPRASTFGHPVTLTATVKIIGSARAVPGGSVTFTDGNSVLATVPLHGGKSSFTTSSLPIGRNVIRATYDGSPNAERSRSAVVIEMVRTGQIEEQARSERFEASRTHADVIGDEGRGAAEDLELAAGATVHSGFLSSGGRCYFLVRCRIKARTGCQCSGPELQRDERPPWRGPLAEPLIATHLGRARWGGARVRNRAASLAGRIAAPALAPHCFIR